MEKGERLRKLEEAQEHINQAIDLIREAIKGTPEETGSEQYIIGHLDNWCNNNNSMDTTIPKMIEGLEEWDEIED